jgi:hypothetical protein
MKKKFTRYIVVIIAILLAALINEFAVSILKTSASVDSPYAAVALSMIITVVVFYPAFLFVNKYLKNSNEKYVKSNNKVTKRRFVGLLGGFLIVLFLLFAAFSQVWYQKNPVFDLKNFVLGLF